MSMFLGQVIDGDVVGVVEVPHWPLRTDRWQALEIVMRRRGGREPLEGARIPGVVRSTYRVLAPDRHPDVHEHEDEGETDQPPTDARGDVQPLPPKVRGICRDSSGHALEA